MKQEPTRRVRDLLLMAAVVHKLGLQTILSAANSLVFLIVASLLLPTRRIEAQTIDWSGPWVGTWSGPGTNTCGDFFYAGGLIEVALESNNSVVAGFSSLNLYPDYGGAGCSFVGYRDVASIISGTVANKKINFIATGGVIDGPDSGETVIYSLVGTNYGTYMTGIMTQTVPGRAFTASVFLQKFAPSATTNRILLPQRTPISGFEMVFLGLSGSNYAFQVSTDLVNWISLANFTYTNSPTILTDNETTNSGAAFYRLTPFPSGTNCPPPPAGLVAWWPGDGNAFDIIGTNNATPIGGVGYAPGKVGQAFDLDGFTGYLDVPSRQSSAFTGPFSIECWINFTGINSADNANTIVAKGPDLEAPLDWSFLISYPNLKLRLLAMLGGHWDQFDCSTTLRSNTWYHVAMVYDGANLKGYVNGVLDGSNPVSGSLASSATPLRIGAYAPVNGTLSKGFFPGFIDELTLYDRALSPSEVASIYLAGSNGKCPPPLP